MSHGRFATEISCFWWKIVQRTDEEAPRLRTAKYSRALADEVRFKSMNKFRRCLPMLVRCLGKSTLWKSASAKYKTALHRWHKNSIPVTIWHSNLQIRQSSITWTSLMTRRKTSVLKKPVRASFSVLRKRFNVPPLKISFRRPLICVAWRTCGVRTEVNHNPQTDPITGKKRWINVIDLDGAVGLKMQINPDYCLDAAVYLKRQTGPDPKYGFWRVLTAVHYNRFLMENSDEVQQNIIVFDLPRK